MQTPASFDLDLTVRSHGFYDLAPWHYDEGRRVLSRPLLLSSGRPVLASVAPGATSEQVAPHVASPQRAGRRAVSERGACAAQPLTSSRIKDGALALRIASEGPLGAGEAAEARSAIRICLSLDEDFQEFHARIRELQRARAGGAVASTLAWALERGAGRLLRSPTVFEDAVKTLCTTNCTWALTRVMTRNLVETLGAPSPGGARCFPTPAAMAERDARFYRDVVRCGYRAPWLRRLACDAASGALDIESWRDRSLATEELSRRIGELDGFGPYATDHLLRLLGRYEHLALDSWTRSKLARLRGRRRIPSDRTIARWFAPYGRHAGLALWLEVTADWHAPGREPAGLIGRW